MHVAGFNKSKTLSVAEVKGWPGTTDVSGTLQSIIRLWDMYDLDLPGLIRGQILHTKTDPLTDREVLDIAETLCESGDKYWGILWLIALSERKQTGQYNGDGSLPEEFINSRLALYYSQYGMPWKSVETLEKFQINGSTEMRANYDYFKSRAAETERRTFSPPPNDDMDVMYKELCNRNNQTRSYLSTLRCYLTKTTVPFIRGKEEVLNRNPRISLFHDVISKSDIEQLKADASKHFLDSSVALTTGPVTDTLTRVSQTHWMLDDEFILRLAWKIKLITGLSNTQKMRCSDSEPLQVLNYGSGGMYRPHLDPMEDAKIPKFLVGSGDRVATWMFYLSSVTAGGATVFPRLRVRIPVVEGAAAFWYNLLDDGQVNRRTLHAGCPVLLGSKWVANRWIHSNAQMFIRPCIPRK
ncbi:prolyl 4-hydroxylase subunit alpha-3-like [Pecten maximus]|uniref:prolyl 4-hydroxylase subunit alpha-3-like n=1 Tax=Pecten maximus TaxID=6579 RepID=UPI0014588D01|nr:prolyl 4-hydroxylase subunit alpha-3-like [Pecten maximus]